MTTLGKHTVFSLHREVKSAQEYSVWARWTTERDGSRDQGAGRGAAWEAGRAERAATAEEAEPSTEGVLAGGTNCRPSWRLKTFLHK